jgi:DNA-binding response OmpR family regulator
MLIADDNRRIVGIVAEYAKKEGFTVDCTYDGTEALSKATTNGYDVILLDVMLPGLDGYSICRAIRRTSTVPIIMVTARGEDFERIMGLDTGADDYVVKPFSPAELMARIRAILRRLAPMSAQVVRHDGLVVDLDAYTTEIDGQRIPLTKKETELLWLLATNRNKVFSRPNLLDSVWGSDYFGDGRTVDSHIRRLRAKLEAVPHPEWSVVTIWGVGYKFEVLT